MIEQIYATAEQAGRVFEQSGCFGADIICSGSSNRCYVLELNAFGDLLPGIEYDGLNTYQYQTNLLMKHQTPSLVSYA